MLSLLAYLSFLTTIALSDITCPTPGAPCEINCNYTINDCANSVVNGSLASNLTITCPTSTSCYNMTAICPTTNDINTCEITCTDSFSCDATTIISESETTILNCITTDYDKTNICTDNTTIILSGNDINMATINCVANVTNSHNETVIVCNDLIVKTLNTTLPKSESLLSFYCQGAGINCDQITIDSTKMNRLQIESSGLAASISNSTFINNDNVFIKIKDNATIALSSFTGKMVGGETLIDIFMNNGGVSNMNNFVFDDVTQFLMHGDNVPGAGLLNMNNITLSNSWYKNITISQIVTLTGINGDNSNVINVWKCDTFTLTCTNNLADCGNIGTINVMDAITVNMSIGSGVKFSNIINASNVAELGLYVFDDAEINGVILNVSEVETVDLNIYGKTHGTNMIYASNAQELYLTCYNDKSCSDLNITTNDNQNVLISCLVDGSCNNITIAGQSAKDITNTITVNCATGLCKDINIFELVTNVEFICFNGSICNNININNDLGKTVLKLNGTKITNFINSFISGHSVMINGDAYMFKNNTIKVDIKGVLNVNGNSQSTFENNIIIHNNDANNCNHILTVKNVDTNNNGIGFEKRNKTLQFNKAEYINITTTKNNQRFIDNDVVIINENASVYIVNYGVLYNNTFNAAKVDLFGLYCFGNCFDGNGTATFMNKLLVNNATHLYVAVGYNDHISDQTIQIKGDGNIQNFHLSAHNNGVIKELTLNNNFKHIEIINNYGMIYKMYVNAKEAEYFTLGCYGGCNKTDTANKYYLENVKYIELDVTNDGISFDNNQFFNISNAELIYLTANSNSTLSDFQFNNSFRTVDTVSLTSNGGILNNIFINATNATYFKFDCNNNGCKNIKQPNTFIINSINNVNFYATNDTINNTNTHIIHDSHFVKTNISKFTLISTKHGSINDIVIATMNSDNITLICNENGEFNNINISSVNISDIHIENNQGIINNLLINNPYVTNKVNISIIGTLTNSTINVKNTNNFNMTCSNVIDNGKEMIAGGCENVTIFTPILSKSNSSLLCQREGCQNMIFYTTNNIDDLSNITLSDCPCDIATKSSCILPENKWEIYCKPDSNGNYNNKPSILNDNNKCNGGCCGNLVNDLKINQCNYNGGGSKKKSKAGAIVGGICGAILFIVMIGCGIYYYKKKKMAEQEALLTVND